MKLFPTRTQVQELNKIVEENIATIEKYKHVQEILVKDILTLQESTRNYKGNDYQSYRQAVAEIARKYNCEADWGCLHTGIIIDLRAAFILGEGVQVKHNTQTRADAERELQWVEDFFEWNDLENEMAQEMAKEAEIEGKVAIRMIYDKKPFGTDPKTAKEWDGMISARYIPWTSRKYTIEADKEDYSIYESLSWNAGTDYSAGELSEEEFVYKKFGGRINNPNEAQPKVMRCLTQIDRLDKALRDLREMNHLYAAPTPDFEVEDSKQVHDLMTRLQNVNWKIGKLLVHTGTFSMKGVDTTGVVNLIKEIEVTLKMISGATGIPIHFLGLLDLLKNRATGDNTRELVMAATARERKIWKGVYEELITKSMEMYNETVYKQMSEGKLDPTLITVDIPVITQEHWDRIEKVLIPASVAGIISKEHVASQIPGVDIDAEAEKKKETDKLEAERAKEELEILKEEAKLNQNQPPIEPVVVQ